MQTDFLKSVAVRLHGCVNFFRTYVKTAILNTKQEQRHYFDFLAQFDKVFVVLENYTCFMVFFPNFLW